MNYTGILPAYPGAPYDFTDKKRLVTDYINQMLTRCQRMFRYTGLPDTIPQRILELYLQVGGQVCITEVGGKLYAVQGDLGGEQDYNYMPTRYTVANPALPALNNMLKIGEDCVVIPSDSLYTGLIPTISRYATLLAENDISLRILDINSRIVSVMSAADEDTRNAAEMFLRDIADGKLGIIKDRSLFDGDGSLGVQPYASTSSSGMYTGLIELHQYLKASMFNDIGLNANWNAKREAIGSNESQLNEDGLLPLVDDMLSCRQEGVERVNAMYGTNITVALDSSWEDVHEEVNRYPESTGTPDDEPEPEKEDRDEQENDA